MPMQELQGLGRSLGCVWHRMPPRRGMVGDILAAAHAQQRPIIVKGILELLEDGNGLLVYLFDNYRVRELSTFVPKVLIKQHGLMRGHEVEALGLPAREGETVPIAVRINKVMGEEPETVMGWTPFTELTPYYPTKRMLLETDNTVSWDNLSMRSIDLLCPVGLGQRGLIVAPPRTGKTVLLQGIANSIVRNTPEAHLIILLVDERPEEVTDFRRQVKQAEIVSSTFDENAESHVHAAEMVIERARRMVEAGRHVVILLDSITRLARAYNTMMPSTGKILSGGVESNALSKPKRFFGSARNIEGAGSLTILGTALVDTGSKMDEVIFEEFKGTGNMELDLDRDLSNKRIFPAISFERSGTRKEELLYHPDEMQKIYSLRRAMKGVPSVEAMEQLIQRLKKTKTNAEFLVTLAR
ncbi:MAG: transcription termination factor Rho [Puniceicoccales bacterium]|nr:transcription termination factor Rho [Puniceicoccales bacterium]